MSITQGKRQRAAENQGDVSKLNGEYRMSATSGLVTLAAAATATPWQTFYSPEGSSSQYGGQFMNAPVWASGLNPTSTGDKLGCVFVDGQAAPEFCAFAYVQKRAPSSKTETNILMDSNRWASFARTGHGIVADNFATAIRSVNA